VHGSTSHALWRDKFLNRNSRVVVVVFVESSRGVGEGERGIRESGGGRSVVE